jgi:DNA-binding transcriptional regulator YiaG
LRKQNHTKPLPDSIKTIGDWIQVKRQEKNLTHSHLAVKMGIATALVRSWESSSRRPDSQQLKVLSSVLGFDAKDFDAHSSNH